MSEAWDGRPQNPERDGHHWLEDFDGIVAKHPRQWSARDGDWCGMSRKEAATWYRYLGPCLTPAEVAAAVAQARREEREACAAHCARAAGVWEATNEQAANGARCLAIEIAEGHAEGMSDAG